MNPNGNIREKILSALEKTKISGMPVSGEYLAKNAGVSRSDINKHIKNLKAIGYRITARPRSGYLYQGAPSEITFKNIGIFLDGGTFRFKIHHYEKTDSTQSLARKFALKNLPAKDDEWHIFVSDSQTAGYGRMRRKWVSSKGGLWFTALIPHPPVEPSLAPAFSLAFSVAVRSAIEKVCSSLCRGRFFLKWPNDILASTDGNKNCKKVAGILTEMSADIQQIEWLAVGCGVNLCNPIPSEIYSVATTLLDITGRKNNPALLLKNILDEAAGIYRIFCSSGFGGAIRAEYEKYNLLRGKSVNVISGDGEEISGVVSSVDDEGHLIIKEYRNDKIYGVKKVFAGDVTLRKQL